MAKLKNKGVAVSLFRPEGEAGAFPVDAGEVVTVQGDVSEETDDAYIIGSDDNVLAWPKSQWELVTEAASAQPAREN